jgi:hypothetical protein
MVGAGGGFEGAIGGEEMVGAAASRAATVAPEEGSGV